MCGFDGIQRGNYLGESIWRTEVKVRMLKLKNGKTVGGLDLEAVPYDL